MSVSQALEKSAKAFCSKYACNFDFGTFESRVEEFTFLRPNNGWTEVYKMVFDRMYKKTLEKAAVGLIDDLDGEAMLDDFEYTLIRPYVKEKENEIKHRPYVGMDRVARLKYLDRLTREAPSNSVALYTEQYKKGELSIKDMRLQIRLALNGGMERKRCVEIAGYIQALENINKSRSLVWRTFHPIKNSIEKSGAAQMKKTFFGETAEGQEFYKEIAAAAYETFDGHKRANDNLTVSMVHAQEEMNRLQQMDVSMR